MKNLIIINSLVLTLISLNASAGLFGASNFEECMSDGKVGRTNAELVMQSNKCRKSFPKLPSLKTKNAKELYCTLSTSKFSIYANMNNKTAKFQSNGQGAIDKITSDKVIFKFDKRDNISLQKNEVIYVDVNYLIGTFVFRMGENVLYGSCEEVN